MEDDPLRAFGRVQIQLENQIAFRLQPHFGSCLCLGWEIPMPCMLWTVRQRELSCMPELSPCIFFSFKIQARAEAGKFGNLPIILCF